MKGNQILIEKILFEILWLEHSKFRLMIKVHIDFKLFKQIDSLYHIIFEVVLWYQLSLQVYLVALYFVCCNNINFLEIEYFFSFLRNLFHFNILQNNVDFIINNIFSNSKGMWSYVSIVGTKTYISMLSLYSIWDYYFSLFTLKLRCPFFQLNFFLYTIFALKIYRREYGLLK